MRIVDLFAGWGGFSLGAEEAGAKVVFAVNHWPLAVQAHSANHPHTRHACQDLRQFPWPELPCYDVLLAAPACQGHSNASQPKRRGHHDALRATAWAITDCVEVTRPKAIAVENVPQFLEWKLFGLWRKCFELLGYHVQIHTLWANEFGVPQLRERVFITATQGADVNVQVTHPGARPPAGDIIDWDDGRWRPIQSARGTAARKRLSGAYERLGSCWVQHVTHHRGLPLSEPFRTITTRDQIAVVRDDGLYRPLTIAETARGMGFPGDYAWPSATRKETLRGLGNAIVPPVATAVTQALAKSVAIQLAA